MLFLYLLGSLSFFVKIPNSLLCGQSLIRDTLMYLMGQLRGIFGDRSVLGHVERLAVIPTVHVSFFICLFPNFCSMCTNTGFQEEEAVTLFINEKK